MDITEHKQSHYPWRVLGVSGETRISVKAGGQIMVETCGLGAVVPMPIAIALQSQEARDFLADPSVAPFLYASSERESRIRAAKLLAQQGITAKRREFVAQAMALCGCSESEAWVLAKIKYPVHI